MKKFIFMAISMAALAAVAGVPGNYVLDKDSLAKSMDEMVAKQMEMVPEEQRAASMEMAKTQMKSTLDAMFMKATFKGDGTVSIQANMGMGGEQSAQGTWSLEGDKLTMTKTHENGEEVEADTMVATYSDGKIIMQGEGSPMAVILVKE